MDQKGIGSKCKAKLLLKGARHLIDARRSLQLMATMCGGSGTSLKNLDN